MTSIDDNPLLDAFISKYGSSKVTSKDLLIVSNIVYLSTAWLTQVPPLTGAAFITITLLVSHTVAPLISNWLNPYSELPLVQETAKILNGVLSTLTAKSICYAIGYQITFKQIAQVTAAFLICVIILKYAIKNLVRSSSQHSMGKIIG